MGKKPKTVFRYNYRFYPLFFPPLLTRMVQSHEETIGGCLEGSVAGGMVRATDLKSAGRGFKSFSDY